MSQIGGLIKIIKTFEVCESINKLEIMELLPQNFKTAAKSEFMKSLPYELDHQDFIRLLMNQTYGGDHVCFDPLIELADLELDNNQNIVFNTDITYRKCKKESYFIWLILSTIKNHPFLSKYINNLFTFSLQKKLELSALPTKNNFKYDFCFDKIQVAIEINENHHFRKKEIIKDKEKLSLTSMHGKSLISIITNKFDNIINIKKIVCSDLICKVKNDLIDFVQIVMSEVPLYNGTKEMLIEKIIYHIYDKFNKKLTSIQIEKNNIFQIKTNDCERLNEIVTNLIEDYVEKTMDTEIHKYIKDSKFIKEFKNDLIDNILNASLNDFDFRADYIKIIFTENVHDMLNDKLDYITKIDEDDYDLLSEYNEDIKDSVRESEDLKNIICNFITNKSINNEFNILLKLKQKSLKYLNNPKNITFKEIKFLFGDYDTSFKNIIKRTCNINRYDKILISWTMLNRVIMAYSENPAVKKILLLYYMELDTIYENIFNRTKSHESKLIGSTKNYDTYMNRLNKYKGSVVTKLENLNMDSENEVESDEEDGIEPESLPIQKKYNSYDIVCLSKINIKERVDILYTRLDGIKQMIVSDSEDDSDDEPKSDDDVKY